MNPLDPLLQGAKAVVPRPFKRVVWLALRNAATTTPPARAALQHAWHELQAAHISRAARHQFRALDNQHNLKLHLGCGDDIRSGWVNIDLRTGGQRATPLPPDATFINYDLRLGLPLNHERSAFIYSSHFFEHLAYAEGLRLLRDCYRVLRPGGVFRIALPDLCALFAAYLRGDSAYFDLLDAFVVAVLPGLHTEERTLIDYVNAGIYQQGEHKYIYDPAKLTTILQRLGYREVARSDYREGIDPPSPLRRRYSFYMEAVK